MRVLYCSSEASPLFKVGGLGDVAGSLPQALLRQGVDVRLVMPFYDAVRDFLPRVPREIDRFPLCFGPREEQQVVRVHQTFLGEARVPVYLFSHPGYLSAYHDAKAIDAHTRFAFFSEAIVAWMTKELSRGGWFPDIVHCNDWHTALVAHHIGIHKKEKRWAKNPATILTIHNLSYQGKYHNHGVMWKNHVSLPKGNIVNLLALGIASASVVTTVSPTYAKEITTRREGWGLESALAKTKHRVVGILNGIDTDVWNPGEDKYLGVKERVGKAEDRWRELSAFKMRNKRLLQEKVGLSAMPDVPVFAFISRLDPQQKGVDILVSVLEEMLPKSNIQCVVLGTGSTEWEERLRQVAHDPKTRRRLAFVDGFDEALAHRIYAGADFMLIPSKFEPCGLVQMIAMRYGTVPVVRATGGLIDTVADGKTGIVFQEYSAKALGMAMRRAVDVFYDTTVHSRIMRAMGKQDFSWKKSAGEYIKLYQRLAEKKILR